MQKIKTTYSLDNKSFFDSVGQAVEAASVHIGNIQTVYARHRIEKEYTFKIQIIGSDGEFTLLRGE